MKARPVYGLVLAGALSAGRGGSRSRTSRDDQNARGGAGIAQHARRWTAVTLLPEGTIDLPVAAGWRDATGARAPGPVDRAVVGPEIALLERTVDLAVAAMSAKETSLRTPVIVLIGDGVSRVALLGAADEAVAANGGSRFEQTGAGTAVAIHAVAVVAGLSAVDQLITADRYTPPSGDATMPPGFHRRAVSGAPVPGRGVAVIAGLDAADDAVAAGGWPDVAEGFRRRSGTGLLLELAG